MKTLYVLDHPRFYEACRRHAAANHLKDFSVFCPQIREHRVPEDLKAHLVEMPAFTPEERDRIDTEAEMWAGRWHELAAVKQNSMHRDLNMAEMLEHGMDYFFVWLFKQRVGALNLLQTLRPSKVLLAKETGCKGPFSAPRESYYGYFFQESVRSQNIPCEVFAEHVASEARSFFEPGYGGWTRLVSTLMNLCSRLLLLFQPGPRAVVLSSMRVAGPLLERRLSRARWMMVTFGPSPRTFLKLFLKGVPTWTVLSQTPAKGKSAVTWTSDFFPAASARFETIFKAVVPALAAWTDAIASFFQMHRIELAVLDEDVTALHRLFVQSAERLSVPCTVIQHGITGNRRGFVPSQSSAIAAWGEVSKAQLQGWGVAAARIHITGFPALAEGDVASRSKTRLKMRARLGVSEGRPVVLFAPCRLRRSEHGFLGVKMSRVQSAEFLLSAVRAARAFPDALLVIRLHPGENLDVQALLQNEGLWDDSRIKIDTQLGLSKLLPAADAMIVSVSSTASVEAMAQDIPVIDWDPFDMYEIDSYDLLGSTARANTQAALEEAIREALKDPAGRREQRKRFVEAYCGPVEGNPTDRVLAFLETLTSQTTTTQTLKEKIACVSY